MRDALLSGDMLIVEAAAVAYAPRTRSAAERAARRRRPQRFTRSPHAGGADGGGSSTSASASASDACTGELGELSSDTPLSPRPATLGGGISADGVPTAADAAAEAAPAAVVIESPSSFAGPLEAGARARSAASWKQRAGKQRVGKQRAGKQPMGSRVESSEPQLRHRRHVVAVAAPSSSVAPAVAKGSQIGDACVGRSRSGARPRGSVSDSAKELLNNLKLESIGLGSLELGSIRLPLPSGLSEKASPERRVRVQWRPSLEPELELPSGGEGRGVWWWLTEGRIRVLFQLVGFCIMCGFWAALARMFDKMKTMGL